MLLIYTSVSCNKNWLDEKADKNLVVPSRLKDFQALLDDNEMFYNSPSQGEIAAGDFLILESNWPNLSTSGIIKNGYTWTYTLPYATTDWTFAYKRIFSCNIVLEGVETISPSSESEISNWKSVKGQALFLRALNFWNIAQIYALAYDSALATTKPGIALRLSEDINIPLSRSTLQQTYDRIIDDLLTAVELLPVIPDYKTRACKSAALGLLSRIFLNVGRYDKAGMYADLVLQSNSYLTDYNQLNELNAYPMELFNSEVIYHCEMRPHSFRGAVATFVNPANMPLYDTNDLRRNLFFKFNANGSIEFKGSYSNNQRFFAGIANDELFLTASEAKARNGNINGALELLNKLLEKRMKAGTFIPYAGLTQQETLDLILLERRKQLLFRGVRWTDLRRLNKEPRTAVTLSRTIGGQTYNLEPNSYKYTFPIPDDIIQGTTLQQNEGW